MHVGASIAKYRNIRKMSQGTLGEKIGMTKAGISKIEQKDSIDFKQLLKIANSLQVPLENFYKEKSNVGIINLYDKKELRDLYPRSIDDYRKLSEDRKSFARALALEIEREVTKQAERNITDFLDNYLPYFLDQHVTIDEDGSTLRKSVLENEIKDILLLALRERKDNK